MSSKKRKKIIVFTVVLAIIISVLVVILIMDGQLKEYEKELIREEKIELEWLNAITKNADGKTKFKLSDTTPFEWDEVYIASGYYKKRDLVELLDNNSNEVFSNMDNETMILGTDLSTTWLFFLEDRLVFELGSFEIFSPAERIERLSERDAWAKARLIEGSERVHVYISEQGEE